MRTLPNEAGALDLDRRQRREQKWDTPDFEVVRDRRGGGGEEDGGGWKGEKGERRREGSRGSAELRSREDTRRSTHPRVHYSLSLFLSPEQAGSRQKAISVVRPPPHSLAVAAAAAAAAAAPRHLPRAVPGSPRRKIRFIEPGVVVLSRRKKNNFITPGACTVSQARI